MKTILISLFTAIIFSSTSRANTKDCCCECKCVTEFAAKVMMNDIQKETESMEMHGSFSNGIKEKLSMYAMMGNIQKETESVQKPGELNSVVAQKLVALSAKIQ